MGAPYVWDEKYHPTAWVGQQTVKNHSIANQDPSCCCEFLKSSFSACAVLILQ